MHRLRRPALQHHSRSAWSVWSPLCFKCRLQGGIWTVAQCLHNVQYVCPLLLLKCVIIIIIIVIIVITIIIVIIIIIIIILILIIIIMM